MVLKDLPFKVRNIEFQLNQVSKHWMMGNPILTHFINSMHVVFPEGEKFFIKSVRKYSKSIQDEQLKLALITFCGQEGVHAREHEKFWTVLEKQGLNPLPFVNTLNRVAFKGSYSLERLSIQYLNLFYPELGDKFALSVTAALEHYTAILAQAVFQEPIFSNENMDAEMLEMLHWHAAEEIEHKSVCFDVLKSVDESEILKITGMLAASSMIFLMLGAGQVYFISQDKDFSWREFPKHLKEFTNHIVLGEIGKGLFRNTLKYFDKNFHPSQIDDNHYAKKFFSDKSYA